MPNARSPFFRPGSRPALILLLCGNLEGALFAGEHAGASVSGLRSHPRCYAYYSGAVGSHAITMALDKYDTSLSGQYAYSGHDSYLTVDGSVTRDGAFRLFEYDEPSNRGFRKLATATIVGSMIGDSLTGAWQGKTRAKRLPFRARRFIPEKREVLKAAIGVHPLIRAGGSMGANGMFGYEREKGKWAGSSSALSEGQREADATVFKKEDQRLLNSLELVVNPDLALGIVAGGDTLLRVPFNPSGMHYRSSSPAGGSGLESDSVYEPARTFYEDKLALAYLDSADFSAALGPLTEDLYLNVADRMRLDYVPVKKEFELTIGHDYFNHTQLIFGPPPSIPPKKSPKSPPRP